MSASLPAGTPSVAAPWIVVRGNVLTVLGIVAGCLLLLAPTARSLHAEWTDFTRLTYTHGYLIAAVSLLALLRAALHFDRPAPDWRLALLLVPAGLGWLVACRAGIELLHQLALAPILFIAVAAAFGLANTRRAWFGFAYLYFATSIWDVLVGPLQKLTVAAVHLMLSATSIPVHVSGTELNIPEGTFGVDPGCSGLHFLIVALSLAVLCGELQRDSPKLRLLQLAIAVALALVSNWIRVYTVVVAGHLTDMQHYLVRVDHYYFGWGVFAVAIVFFFWITSRLPAAPLPPAPPPGAPPRARVLVTGAALSLGLLALGPAYGLLRPLQPAPPRIGPPLALLAGWSGPAAYAGEWDPLYPHSDRAQRGVYQRAGRVVAAFAAEYDIQLQGKELVGYGNSLFNGLGQTADQGIVAVDTRWRRVATNAGESIIAWRLRVGAHSYTRGLTSQLGYALGSLAGPQRSRVSAALAPCEPDCNAALESARQLVDDLDKAQGGAP